ncbi:MAG TPA: hypothetical protein PKD55_05065 [Bellilinea sp.]|nr:hypothetical protein [Bellilinea sp.]
MEDDPLTFSPRDAVLSALRYWWVIVLLAILGALVTLGISGMRKPAYEATAKAIICIDYTSTGILPQSSEDIALASAGEIFLNRSVVETMLAELKLQYPELTYESLFSMLSIERHGAMWNLRVRAADYEQAAIIANTWLKIGVEQIQSAQEHAEKASAAGMYVRTLAQCLDAVMVNAALPTCPFTTMEELQQVLAQAQATKSAEEALSLGVQPLTRIGAQEEAQVPIKVARYDQGLLVFSGALIGLTVGILLLPLLTTKKRA